MRKMSILVVLAASTFLSSYGVAACVKGIRGCAARSHSVRASNAAVANVRWRSGRRANRGNSTVVNTKIGVESYPVPE